MKRKVICFGAGGGGERLFESINERYSIIAFTDNDISKWGGEVRNIPILPVEEALGQTYDLIVLTSEPGKDTIIKQLMSLGIREDVIDTSFVDFPIDARRVFLKRLALMQQDIDPNAAVAEAGVFAGDFAKYINEYYPKRICHLFDTFSGFDKRDIDKEDGRSIAKEGDYSITSEQLVFDKMPCKDKVVIHKGYFPDTALNIKDKFCFVNLDLDLYDPTYKGLCFFSEKMVHGGVILIHDYFAENFKGPYEAVNRFCEENKGNYGTYPIGDGISVMVTGF